MKNLITSLLLIVTALTIALPASAEETVTLATLTEAAKTATVGRDSAGKVVVMVPTRPELGHAMEALVNRGLAVPTSKGIQLRPELTQTELEAALARKGWAVAEEVRRNRTAIAGLQAFVANQVGLNWIFGLSIVGLAITVFRRRSTEQQPAQPTPQGPSMAQGQQGRANNGPVQANVAPAPEPVAAAIN